MESIIAIKQHDDEFFKVSQVDSPEVLARFKTVENSYFMVIHGSLVAFPIDEIVKDLEVMPKHGHYNEPGVYASNPVDNQVYDLNEIINRLWQAIKEA